MSICNRNDDGHEGISIDDTGMILVKFENGVFGVLDYSWSRPKSFPVWGDVTMEIIGLCKRIQKMIDTGRPFD
jgi:hypothetical protein